MYILVTSEISIWAGNALFLALLERRAIRGLLWTLTIFCAESAKNSERPKSPPSSTPFAKGGTVRFLCNLPCFGDFRSYEYYKFILIIKH